MASLRSDSSSMPPLWKRFQEVPVWPLPRWITYSTPAPIAARSCSPVGWQWPTATILPCRSRISRIISRHAGGFVSGATLMAKMLPVPTIRSTLPRQSSFTSSTYSPLWQPRNSRFIKVPSTMAPSSCSSKRCRCPAPPPSNTSAYCVCRKASSALRYSISASHGIASDASTNEVTPSRSMFVAMA